jgi:hypothetical protein
MASREQALVVDRIVLAQASMARIEESRPAQGWPVPLLTSPHAALAKLRGIFAGGE